LKTYLVNSLRRLFGMMQEQILVDYYKSIAVLRTASEKVVVEAEATYTDKGYH